MAAQYFAGTEKSSMLPLRLALGAVFIMHGGRTLAVNGLPWLAGFLENLGVPAPMVCRRDLIAHRARGRGGAADRRLHAPRPPCFWRATWRSPFSWFT